MAGTVNFALRLPPELKAAAKALTAVFLYKPSANREEGYVDGIPTDSVNEALISLMRCGLKPMLGYAQAALDEASERHEPLHELMGFFMANPTADRARTVNFAGKSKVRAFIEADLAAHVANVAEHLPDGVDRAWVADEYAISQRNLLNLTAAKGAIQKALAP